jgi:hypothetical protein
MLQSNIHTRKLLRQRKPKECHSLTGFLEQTTMPNITRRLLLSFTGYRMGSTPSRIPVGGSPNRVLYT